jgi:hypothetical protein
MAQEDREKTQEELDVAEIVAVQTLKLQLSSVDEKIANKAANDIVGIRLKQAPGAGGPVLNLHFGEMSAGMRQVKDASSAHHVEIIEAGT